MQRVMKSKLEELEDDVEVVPILEEVSKFYMEKILYVHLSSGPGHHFFFGGGGGTGAEKLKGERKKTALHLLLDHHDIPHL